MGLSPVELIVVVLVIVLLIRAINRGGGAAAAVGLMLLLAIGGWGLLRARRGEMHFPAHQVQHAAAPAWEMQHGPTQESHLQTTVYPAPGLSIVAMLILVMTAVAALAVGRRHGLSIGGLLALAIAGVVLFMFLGTVAYHRVEVSPPHIAMSVPGPHGDVHVNMPAEPPLDDLWERLNESRIELSSPAAGTEGHKAATAGRAAAQDPAADDPPADESAEASAHENEDAASEESTDEAADEHVDQSTSETTDDPPAHDADLAESPEPSAAAEPAAEASVEQAAPPVKETPPPVEPAAPPHPAAEPFADPTVEDWPQEPASPAPPAASEALAALPDPEPKPRPEWVGTTPKKVGNIYRVPVQAGPYVTLRECYDQLRNEMRTVVQQRVEELVRESTGTPYVHIPDLDWMHIGASYIDGELLTDDYVEINDTSVGTMRTAWGLLEFTSTHDRYLVDSWKRYARQDRMALVATIAALVVGALGGVLLLLKIDTWTRGYYTKRLFLGVPAAIIALLAFSIMIAEM